VQDRRDLAAMIGPLVRRLLALEGPILEAHGVSMWAYVVLSRLCEQPYRGQNVLAEAIGADKTRIIDVLDDLQQRGLITRQPDPADRRARVLDVTATGRRLREQIHRAIRREEDRLLADLPARDRDTFVRVLHELADAVTETG
jgi:DNA-binding MarR family transcriptional regulator